MLARARTFLMCVCVCVGAYVGFWCAQVPVFVKVRLLDTVEDSVELVEGLAAAGAALVAIHAR